jgi:hypothetical protein
MGRKIRRLITGIALSIFFLLVNKAYCAVGYNRASSASVSGNTVLSWSHQVSGTNRLLIVSVVHSSGSTISSVTYNGTNLLPAVSVTNSPIALSLWYMVNPSIGTHVVRVTLNSVSNMVGGAQSFTGVDQMLPLGIPSSNRGIGSGPATVTVVSGPEDMIVDAYGAAGNTVTAGTGQTQRFNLASTYRGAGSTKTGSPLVNMSWTPGGATVWALAGVALKAVSLLPVDLLNFQARADNGAVELNWTTVTEDENDYFSIERSSNGKTFEEIGRIKGAGTSRQVKTYMFRDVSPLEGISYYRLRQTDFDGSPVSFPPVSVYTGKGLRTSRSLVIKRMDEMELQCDVYSDRIGQARLSVFNILGKECFSHQVDTERGVNEIILPIKDLPRGIYFITLYSQPENKEAVKFVK